MSKKQEIVVGLDIGTTKIALIVGRKTEHDKLEILGYGAADSAGVERGMVANLDRTIDSIKKAYENLQSNSDFDITVKKVQVGIAGQHIKSTQTTGVYVRPDISTTISREDIEALLDGMYRLVVAPGEQIYDVVPQDYCIDDQAGITDPIGRNGTRIEANVHLITGKIEAVRNIKTCVEVSGFEMTDITLEPLASADAVLSEDEKEGGVVLVDIGGGTTDVAIFLEGTLRHTAVIPMAGNIITEDIQQGCHILKRYAEALKKQYGACYHDNEMNNKYVTIPSPNGGEAREISLTNLTSIINARMEEILGLVALEIETSRLKNKLHMGIVITGGGSKMKHICQLSEYVTGMHSRIGLPNQHLANSDKFEILNSPIYSTGIGLVMKGFSEGIFGSVEIETSANVSADKPIGSEERKRFTKKISGKNFLNSIVNYFDDNEEN